MRVCQRGISDRNESELCQRKRARALHQFSVAGTKPDERHNRLKQRKRESENERVMADLDDHRVAPCVLAELLPPCQTPCFFKASAISRGM